MISVIGMVLFLVFCAYLVISDMSRREKFRQDCDAKIIASRRNCDPQSEQFWKEQKDRANSKYF